ncbi:MAG TPA: hypothetical protein ENK18_20715 [Deltaproteobacteria bacterium]|nr:hypothetical protein [Deltaproteobacteria bacterium]
MAPVWMLPLALSMGGCSRELQDPAPLIDSPFTSWTDQVTSRIRAGLPGARVREGSFWYLKQEDCGPIVLENGTCHGAHPASPYGMFDYPEDAEASDEILDYDLDQHEALLFVGHTPPESRYFSFNHHQYRKAMPDGSERITFATMAPAMHLLELSTASSLLAPGEMRDLSEVVWQDYTVVIFTANQTTADRLRGLLTPILVEAGYSPDIINVHTIALANQADHDALIASGMDPSDVFTLNMGYGPGTDTYNVVMRVAATLDPEDPYLFPETINAATFKIAFEDPPGYDPFPWPVFPPPDETGEEQARRVRSAQEAVFRALQEQIIPPELQTVEVETFREPQKTGAECINLLDSCGANNDDARYHRSSQRFYIPEPHDPASVFLVGINHTKVAKLDPGAPQITYMSLTLNNFTRGFGVRTRLDHELEGSLEYWFDPEDLPEDFNLGKDELDSIYVVQFARDCSVFNWEDRYGAPNPYCVEFDDGIVGICPLDKFWFTERVYLNQTSGTAPAQTSVYPPLTLGVGPSISFVDAGLAVGGWTLSDPPQPAPSEGYWCSPGGGG